MKPKFLLPRLRSLFFILATLTPLLLTRAGDWPQWRGKDRSNASPETGLLNTWPINGPPLAWRATGIGTGIHSVAIVNGRVFVVGNRQGQEFLFALDEETGQKLWALGLGKPLVEENRLMRWLTQRTPTIDKNLAFVFSINGALSCVRVTDGQLVWKRSYPADFGTRRHPWGFCDRPLVDHDQLIVTPFGTNVFIAALHPPTGSIVWQTKLSDPPSAGQASLVVTEAGGVRQYIVFHGRGLSGFAADNGQLLWDYPRPKTRTAMSYTPTVREDMIYSPNGYGGGLVAIRLVRENDRFTVKEVYDRSIRFGPFTDTTASFGDILYGFDGKNPFGVNLKTGKSVWNSKPETQLGSAFFTYAQGHLYARYTRGRVSLINVSIQGAEAQSYFDIPEHEESYGVTAPVITNGRLWLRDNNRLFCYDISASAFDVNRPDPPHVAIGLTDQELGVAPDAPGKQRVGVNRAPDAVYVPTPLDIVDRMLQEANVKKSDLVVDLGSGDGRFIVAAAKQFGSKAIGYEIDPRLVQESRDAISKESLGDRASIEHQDIFTLDLSHADVVTVFLYPRLMERLIPQFEVLKPGSRIVSHQFEMPGIKPDKILIVESKEDGDQHRIFLWTTPLKRD